MGFMRLHSLLKSPRALRSLRPVLWRSPLLVRPFTPRRLHAIPVQLREYSNTPSTTTTLSIPSVLWMTAGVLVGGGLVYYIVTERGNNQVIPSSVAGLNNVYGTRTDFQAAIDELKVTFPKDGAVSTDQEDLETHGFSENDYHPGALMYFCKYILIERSGNHAFYRI